MTSVKISTTGEMLAVLPYQLGHQLDRCVVIGTVRGKALGPVARTDLPSERESVVAGEQLLASLLRVEPELALLVGYESVPGESRSLRHALHVGLTDAGVGIIDHVVVRDGRWWGGCCRPSPRSLDGLVPGHVDGHPLVDSSSVAAVAELIATGSAPLSSREEVSALVAEDAAASPGVGAALARLTDEGVGGPDRVPDLWARVLAPEGTRGETLEASDDEVALMLHSLRDKPWRDALIAWMSAVMFPLDLVDDASSMLLAEAAPAGPVRTRPWSRVVLQRLLALTRRVPDACSHDAAAICTVAACVAWGLGTGSTAGDAVTRALRVSPGYPLAGYLGRLIEFQVRPRRQWADVAA
jgi:hypothetical protein